MAAIAAKLCRKEQAIYTAFYHLDMAHLRLYTLSEKPWAKGEEAEAIKMVNEGLRSCSESPSIPHLAPTNPRTPNPKTLLHFPRSCFRTSAPPPPAASSIKEDV